MPTKKLNQIVTIGGTALVPLFGGGGEHVAIIDADDALLVAPHHWIAYNSRGIIYARAVIGRKRIRMHRLILNAEAGKEIDHINRNSLDNRRSNLRFASRSLNVRNINRSPTNVAKSGSRWAAAFVINGRYCCFGRFVTRDAAIDCAAGIRKRLLAGADFTEVQHLLSKPLKTHD